MNTPTEVHLTENEKLVLELAKTHMKPDGFFDWKKLREEQPELSNRLCFRGDKGNGKGSQILRKLRNKGVLPEPGEPFPPANNGEQITTGALTDQLMAAKDAARIEMLVKARVKAILEDGDRCSRCGSDLTHLRHA